MCFSDWIIIMLMMIVVKTSAICTDCWQNVSISKCNYTHCTENSNCENELDLNVFTLLPTNLHLLCRDSSSLTFVWSNMNDKHYFLQYSLKNDSNNTNISYTTRCNILTVTNLTSNEMYDVYLYAYSVKEAKLYKSNKISVETAQKNYILDPVESINYTLSVVNGAFEANVFWKPGSDLTCYYNILYHGKREQSDFKNFKFNLKNKPERKIILKKLEFGDRYHFEIMSTRANGEKESARKYIQIKVPYCLNTSKDLSMCFPIRPKNLTLKQLSPSSNSNTTTLQLNWERPPLIPEFYLLKVETFNNNALLNANVSGDNNVWTFKDVLPFSHCKAQITAMTKAGSSKSRIIQYPPLNQRKLTTEVVDDSQSYWIWILCLLMVIKILGLVAFRRRIRTDVIGACFDKEKSDSNIVKFTAANPEDSRWELSESKLFIDKVIGFGAFGIVQKGCYYLEADKKIVVAIKTLKAKPNEEQIAQFYDEIEIMKSVPYHAHIVHLIGVVTKNRPSNPLMLVEYCSGGDLQSYLRKVAFIIEDSSESKTMKDCQDETAQFFNKSYDMFSTKINGDGQILKPNNLLSFARQIVLGMEYLSNLKVIHRDLAARNVLITEDNTLKISDFGLSRDIYTDSIYRKVTGGKLPFRWMALESLTHQIYTTESDVWSFGIVLWEIVTLGCNPYPSINTEDLVTLLKSGYRMKKPNNCTEDLYQIMLDCWHATPNVRPSFKQLRETFDRLLESKMEYVCLDNCVQLRNSNSYENMCNQI